MKICQIELPCYIQSHNHSYRCRHAGKNKQSMKCLFSVFILICHSSHTREWNQ